MKKVLTFAVFALAFMLSAADTKVAVFNLEQVFKEYYKTPIYEAFINDQRLEYQKYLNSLSAEAAKMEDEFKVLRDSSQNIALDVVERENKRQAAERKSREIQAKRNEMETYGADKAREFQDLTRKRRDDIMADITAMVAKRAAVEGYQLVLDVSGRGANTDMPSVVYFSPSLDITQSLIDELNRGNQLPAQAAKPPKPAKPETPPAEKPAEATP